jgi:hypothetical protein
MVRGTIYEENGICESGERKVWSVRRLLRRAGIDNVKQSSSLATEPSGLGGVFAADELQMKNLSVLLTDEMPCHGRYRIE